MLEPLAFHPIVCLPVPRLAFSRLSLVTHQYLNPSLPRLWTESSLVRMS